MSVCVLVYSSQSLDTFKAIIANTLYQYYDLNLILNNYSALIIKLIAME